MNVHNRNDNRPPILWSNMAKRRGTTKRAKRAKRLKYQTMETRINLKWNTAGSDNSSTGYKDSVFIDVAQCLSTLNRKLVRQGQVFRIKGLRAYTNDSSPDKTMLKVGVLPRNWPMFNGYKKARAIWNKHNLAAVENIGASNLPKWYDFKAMMNPTHVKNVENAGDANLLIHDFDDTHATGGEWVYSKIHDSGATSNESYIHIMGGHMSNASTVDSDGDISTPFSIGAILAYQQSRGLPFANQDRAGQEQTANYGSLSPWARVFGDDDQTGDTLVDLMSDNDSPPYDREDYFGTPGEHPGALTVWYGRLASEASQQGNTSRASIPTFEAPLGLLQIELDAGSSTDSHGGIHIQFDVDILGEI